MKTNRVILVSYPKSGSNWIRYGIEYFSKKSTPGTKRKLLHPDAELIIDRTHFLNKLDRRLFVEYRSINNASYTRRVKPAHAQFLSRMAKWVRREHVVHTRRLLLLLRDPCELYVRVEAKNPLALQGYFTNILLFDRARRSKLIKYYEDVVSNFTEVREILDFLDIPNRGQPFDVEEHRRHSLELYKQGQDGPASESDLMNFSYHSHNLTPEIRSEIEILGKSILGEERFQYYLGRYKIHKK